MPQVNILFWNAYRAGGGSAPGKRMAMDAVLTHYAESSC